MSIVLDVQARYAELSQRLPGLRWFALVDGYQYEQYTGHRMESVSGFNRSLFDGTEDGPLAHAGPWLLDLSKANQSVYDLATMEQTLPAMSWLIAAKDLEALALCLQSKLSGKLPNGRKALVRFYDPRVLGNLLKVMEKRQRGDFLAGIDEWHFIYEGKRVWRGSKCLS